MVFNSSDGGLSFLMVFCVSCSASVDGRIFVRRILEGPSPEVGKVLITEQILLAIEFIGDWKSCHPRVCWNLQMQASLKDKVE